MLVFRVITALILLVTPVAVSAQAQDQALYDACPSIEQLAVAVMTARQLGVSMSELMTSTGSDPVGHLTRIMIQDAYKVTRFSSELYRQEAIDEFGAKYASICYNTAANEGITI